MTSVIRFDTPAAGFDDPEGLWLACHQRVRRFAGLLPRLAEHVRDKGADAEAQQAASAVRRYFNEAAPRHHEDEEVDLFPRLADAGPAVSEAIERLEAEHSSIGRMWRTLDALLARIAAGEAVPLPAELLAAFADAYAAHIALEESVLLTALQRTLTPDDWRAVGTAMAERRGMRGAAAPE